MSYCFLIKSNDEIIQPIKDCLSTLFDHRIKSKIAVESYCYCINKNNVYVFSYSFSNRLIEAKMNKKEVKFYLSELGVSIIRHLIRNKIKFTFSLIDLKNKEDEEMIIGEVIKSKIKNYDVLRNCIEERVLYYPEVLKNL